MNNAKTPEHVLKRLNTSKEYRSKPEEPMAKPAGITQRGSKFKVTLYTHGKQVHIGYFKTLDQAKDALEKAKRDCE